MKIKNTDNRNTRSGHDERQDESGNEHSEPGTGRRVQARAGHGGRPSEVVATGGQAAGQRVRRGRRLALWLAVLVPVLVVVLLVEPAAWASAAAGGIAEVKSFASRLTGYVTAASASVAVLFMAVNGLRWTMSSGNPSRQAEARNGLVAAMAGLAIALSAGVIVNLVIAALG